MSDYPDLHCHSTFSLQDGLGAPEQVADRAVALGWSAACLTEHGWMGGAPRFYKACIERGIKPIIGVEFYVVPDDALGERTKEFRDASRHLTVLALSKEGYQNLVAWTTFSMRQENFYYKPRISIGEMVLVANSPLSHNVILTGCLGSELNVALSQGTSISNASAYISALKSVFPNVFIEIQHHKIGRFSSSGYTAYEELLEREEKLQPRLIELSRVTGIPLCLTNDSHYQSPTQRKAHVAMRAAAWRHRDDSHYGKSDEQVASSYLKDYAYFGNYMRDMEKVCDGIPHEALDSISEITHESSITLDPLDRFSYSIPFSGYEDPIARIRSRCRSRLAVLSRRHGKMARERFELELGAMGEFAHYLLLMSDFIRHAKNEGVLTNTRGSAANSLLCYCLKIHDVDSIEYGLTFSRFFNPARKKLPDIDIDIEADRYDDFMEFVHERMNALEGEGQVLQICNFGTLANRAAFRQAATALGVPKEKQDEISKLLPQMIDSGMVEGESDAYEVLKDEYPELHAIASEIFDSIRSVGQHACGWVFGTSERPLDEWVPEYRIASSGKSVSQYDLNSLEDFGLVKGDFLRLRTLSVVKRTLALLGKDSLDLEAIPLDDPDTYAMLREGKTEGIFTLQGKENRRGCIEVRVDNIRDVINSVALYRPALTRTGLHKRFNDNKHGRKDVNYPHEICEAILGPTYGVPLFQEQAMELGYAVGMNDKEVDEIFQAIKMSKGVGRHAKKAFAKIEPKFYKRALTIMSQEEADGVWNEIKAFQGYGFNKGHATSYGILAVRAAYLKCHFPSEFFAALLDTYPEKHRYVAAARSEQFKFLRPSINESGEGFGLDRSSGAIRVGLGRVRGLGPVAAKEIVAGQPFSSLDDLRQRTNSRAVNSRKVEILSQVGALECVGIKGDASDATEFQTLGFCTKKPRSLCSVKPKHVNRRISGNGWNHLGLAKHVEITEGRSSVSKLFWIPPDIKLELKASPWAQVKTFLLEAVDVNGIVFHLMASQDKQMAVLTLKFLHQRCQDRAVCLDGRIRQPYLTDGPMGFTTFNIAGQYQNDPQIFPIVKGDSKYINAIKTVPR